MAVQSTELKGHTRKCPPNRQTGRQADSHSHLAVITYPCLSTYLHLHLQATRALESHSEPWAVAWCCFLRPRTSLAARALETGLAMPLDHSNRSDARCSTSTGMTHGPPCPVSMSIGLLHVLLIQSGSTPALHGHHTHPLSNEVKVSMLSPVRAGRQASIRGYRRLQDTARQLLASSSSKLLQSSRQLPTAGRSPRCAGSQPRESRHPVVLSANGGAHRRCRSPAD